MNPSCNFSRNSMCSVYYKTYWQQSDVYDVSNDTTVTVPQSPPFKAHTKNRWWILIQGKMSSVTRFFKLRKIYHLSDHTVLWYLKTGKSNTIFKAVKRYVITNLSVKHGLTHNWIVAVLGRRLVCKAMSIPA